MKIVMVDDETERASGWKQEIDSLDLGEGVSVEVLTRDECIAAIQGLEKRRSDVRSRKDFAIGDNGFDSADVLIVDYDLFNLKSTTTSSLGFVTGEHVSYLARCYSKCGFIVAVNQHLRERGNNYFDLTLSGDMDSYADVNVTEDQLTTEALWLGTQGGFCPWYWPRLKERVENFPALFGEAAAALDVGILEFFKLTDLLVNRDALSYLEVGGDSAESTTFRGFVKGSNWCLRGKDETIEALYPRIAAARVSKWLNEQVLWAQNVLVDSPHLAYRYPSLLDGSPEEITDWNTCAAPGTSGLKRESITGCEFEKSSWLHHEAWISVELSQNTQIAEIAEPWNSLSPDFVFCEDISAFVPRDQARPFVADVPPPYQRRFIVSQHSEAFRKYALQGANYWPSVRLIS